MTAILTNRTPHDAPRRAARAQRRYAVARNCERLRVEQEYAALGGRAFDGLNQEGMGDWVAAVGRDDVVCACHNEPLLTEAEARALYPGDGELDDWREILGDAFFCRREAHFPQTACRFVQRSLWERATASVLAAAGRDAMNRAVPARGAG